MTETDPRQRLLDKGVIIPHPRGVSISPEVDLDRIATGVTIFPGCRIAGADTFIMSEAVIGREGPATIENCHIAKGVELKGGYFKASVFLDNANMGAGAHVREACLLEEEAGGAHTVGLKQTILMPFVTLGSLINFCDCLMAGGTSRNDHSEVGSSYIHFNYTPQQDKATPSLIGDVPRGVMLRERPIFLGGQGGLVGPSTIGFGAVIAAGLVFKGDLADGRLTHAGQAGQAEHDFIPGLYGEIRPRVLNNIRYIANIMAFRQWYVNVRSLFLVPELTTAALNLLGEAVDERMKRLKALAMKMPESVKNHNAWRTNERSEILIRRQTEFHAAWQAVEDSLTAMRNHAGDAKLRDAFLKELSKAQGPYLRVIRDLNQATCRTGTQWLENIVNSITLTALKHLPSFTAA
jgi:UDP-N-acetylglucosamine/UDP-N-acetylgalactosamine diphosphorylase